MTSNNIILKSISHLFLGVMIYMHVCSAWCAMSPGGGCCKMENTGGHKSCCKHDHRSNTKDHSCQDFHLTFFKTAGQFSSEKNIDVVKDFPIIVADIPVYDFASFTDINRNQFAFNNYHPPPPIEDIRVFIRSFQI